MQRVARQTVVAEKQRKKMPNVLLASPAMGHWGTWGTGARAPPRLPTISFSVQFRVNPTANIHCVVYENIWFRCQQLIALSISTASVTKLRHRAAAARVVRRECPMA